MKTLIGLALFAMALLTHAETMQPSVTPDGAVVQPEPAKAQQPILFWAKWCPYCRAAEAYLNENKISFQKEDVDTPEGKRGLLEAGARGIPVLLIDGKKIQGFSRPAYDEVFGKR